MREVSQIDAMLNLLFALVEGVIVTDEHIITSNVQHSIPTVTITKKELETDESSV